MIAKRKGLIILFCVFILFIIGSWYAYYNRISYIRSYDWKYDQGANIGDIINFDNDSLKNKFIYRNEQIIGKVIFCYRKTLIIKNLESGKTGYYSGKRLFKK